MKEVKEIDWLSFPSIVKCSFCDWVSFHVSYLDICEGGTWRGACWRSRSLHRRVSRRWRRRRGRVVLWVDKFSSGEPSRSVCSSSNTATATRTGMGSARTFMTSTESPCVQSEYWTESSRSFQTQVLHFGYWYEGGQLSLSAHFVSYMDPISLTCALICFWVKLKACK